ncbi:MAG: Holliday junction branch migration protein RuvA [Selenomonas sp.]|uniref:Holliday junction branch migration protein RuvA n=1 Tax=Selenomonas sp. TaxID=2053611 RepID=UPI0025CF20AC|nr:Holliday junction branch migration protein RuvA [Selenomonas sp.]MCI6099955.1 Holliday junction branch migration protein RuvA [Selenomonas sp.]MCI6231480.1 Holliday junction branch migration protein RuvA [Selenomonas sp.]
MIGYLRGTVAFLHTDTCLLDVNGVGYRVYISDATRRNLAKGKEAQLFTYLSVREDALQLYGFRTEQEYDMFLALIGISGIGPKVALGILSSITISRLATAITNQQTSVLTKLPGIGKKSAERLILELKDKLSFASAQDEQLTLTSDVPVGDDILSQTSAALESLGYTSGEIAAVLPKLSGIADVQAALKQALKLLARTK